MAIAFTLVGIVLIVTSAQNTYAQLGALVQNDFTGPKNFFFWLAALAMVGVLGYIPQLKTFSAWFMSLVLLSLFLSHKGFFANITSALQSSASGAGTPGQGALDITFPKTGQTTIQPPGNTGAAQGIAAPLGGFFDLLGAPSPLPGY